MKATLPTLALGAAATFAACGFAASGAQAETIVLRDITTPIVPTAVLAGDREFGGNGPRITVGVELTIERGGRAIFANVHFAAVELGGDGSRTEIGPVPILVWRWEDEACPRLVERINSQRFALLTHDSAPGCGFGCATISAPGLVQEDGGVIVTVVPQNPGPVADMTLLGDTAGDDISADNDPYGDTSLRAVRFNPIDVTFASSIACD